MEKTILMINVHEDDVLCFRKEVILGLADSGYKVVLLYPLGNRQNELTHENIEHVDISMDRHGYNIFKDGALLIRYFRAIKKYDPFVVLLYTIKPNVYGSIASRLAGKPYINNITGIGSTLYGDDGSLLSKFIIFLYKIALKKSSHVFFQNSFNSAYFLGRNICDKNRSSIIPGSGVDLNRFKYEEYPVRDNFVFNYIGRVMKKKGVLDYVKAAQIIKGKHSNCEFNILGFVEDDETELKKIIKDAQDNGAVIYRGNQPDIQPWIAQSDAIILPSKYGEGISNVLLETAATGRGLITTTIPGCKDVVENNNGFLFEPGDVDGLVNCVERFMSLSTEERINMGKRSREHVEKNFSRQVVVNEYEKLVNKVFENGEIH